MKATRHLMVIKRSLYFDGSNSLNQTPTQSESSLPSLRLVSASSFRSTTLGHEKSLLGRVVEAGVGERQSFTRLVSILIKACFTLSDTQQWSSAK